MKLLYRAFTLFIAVMCISSNSYAQKSIRDSLRISEYPPYDKILPGGFVKFGIQTGFIFTKNLETGMDCGARISQRFFHPYFSLTSQFHFWAASKKNADIGVACLEESITYNIPIHSRLSGYAGFTAAYSSILKQEKVFNGTEYEENDSRTEYLEPYVTFGFEYFLDRNRSIFLEGELGKTILPNEVHLLIGLNFYRHKKSHK